MALLNMILEKIYDLLDEYSSFVSCIILICAIRAEKISADGDHFISICVFLYLAIIMVLCCIKKAMQIRCYYRVNLNQLLQSRNLVFTSDSGLKGSTNIAIYKKIDMNNPLIEIEISNEGEVSRISTSNPNFEKNIEKINYTSKRVIRFDKMESTGAIIIDSTEYTATSTQFDSLIVYILALDGIIEPDDHDDVLEKYVLGVDYLN